jgi:hypothetical protein
MPKAVLPEAYTFEHFRNAAIIRDKNKDYQQAVSISHAVDSMIAGEKMDKSTIAVMGLLIRHLLVENESLKLGKKSKK